MTLERQWRATHNLLAVSANDKETAINTEQTLDTTIPVDMSVVADLERRRESNADEATGTEEPNLVYDLGNKARLPLSFSKAQPQHFALVFAYGLGAVSTAAAGAGYEHTCTPIDGDEDADRSNPSFTAAMRYGLNLLKRRFASMFVNAFTCTFSKDDWCKLTAECIGTGKVADNITEETVAVTPGADPFPLGTDITLAANAVNGSTAAERLASVHRIRAELSSGEWTERVPSAVSDATPAVITVPALAAEDADDVDHKILYIPDESGWHTFPARVTETPLRVSQMTIKLGGAWDGSDFQGGRELQAEVSSLEWSFANNGAVEFVPGGGDAYASRYVREGRTQSLRLNREFREYILQQHIDDNDDFGVYILAEGGAIDGSHNYQVELIFPKCAVLDAPLSVDGKRLAEAGDLLVMEDATYGSVIAKVKNAQATYAA